MPDPVLTLEFSEDFTESRQISISDTALTEEFIFYMCGNFLEMAEDQGAYGFNDDVVALKAAYSILPAYFFLPTPEKIGEDHYLATLILKNASVSMITYDKWKVTASYSTPERGEGQGRNDNVNPSLEGPQMDDYLRWSTGYVQLSFNISAEITNQKMSERLLAAHGLTSEATAGLQSTYPLGKPTPVGQTVDDVQGDDIYERKFGFEVTVYKIARELSFKAVRRLYRMACTLNDRPFFGFPPGSCLFLEAQAQGDIYSVVPLTLRFETRPNILISKTTASAVCSPDEDDPSLMYDIVNDPYFDTPLYTQGVWKKYDSSGNATQMYTSNVSVYSGWVTIDYRYGAAEVNDLGLTVQKPIYRLIHQQYYYSNFDKLGIGHAPAAHDIPS